MAEAHGNAVALQVRWLQFRRHGVVSARLDWSGWPPFLRQAKQKAVPTTAAQDAKIAAKFGRGEDGHGDAGLRQAGRDPH